MIRTGYGRGYDLGVFGSIFGHNVTQNLPVLGIQTLAAGQQFRYRVHAGARSHGAQPGQHSRFAAEGSERPSACCPTASLRLRYPNPIRLPTVDAWNFTVQRQMTNTISLEAAYVGTKGTHVFAGTGGDYDPNQATLAGFGTLTTNQRKPFFQKFGWSQNLRYYGSDASNNYHSLQVKVDKRFSQGLQVMSHYTWSRNMDFYGTYFPVTRIIRTGPPTTTALSASTCVLVGSAVRQRPQVWKHMIEAGGSGVRRLAVERRPDLGVPGYPLPRATRTAIQIATPAGAVRM